MKALSFHLSLETHWNRVLPKGGHPSPEDISAMEEADAVILPQGCREELYNIACLACPNVFPNYSARFEYPGKTGQADLFSFHGVCQPEYLAVTDSASLRCCDIPFGYPFVVKSSWGGEGKNVILVNSVDDEDEYIARADQWDAAGLKGILIQEYIPAGGRSLRVVVIGTKYYSYWRVAGEGSFYTNLAKGAVIDYDLFPELQKSAVRELKKFCSRSRVDLAGFDFLFSVEDENPQPLFLEINYAFRTRGLGGPDRYLELLTRGVREWLDDL